jgi:hypothetical protein
MPLLERERNWRLTPAVRLGGCPGIEPIQSYHRTYTIVFGRHVERPAVLHDVISEVTEFMVRMAG